MRYTAKITALLLAAALIVPFGNMSAFAEEETANEEIQYDMTDAIDDCTDFETVYAKSDGIILDQADADNLSAFEGDYTFFQRNTSLDEWVIYEVPDKKQLEFITYFWLGEEMIHFKFEYSTDGENWKKAYPTIDAKPPQTGKWTPVSYTLDTLPDDAEYVKMTFQNLNGVSWSPCIANVRAHSVGGESGVFEDIAGKECERAVTILKYLGLIDGYSDTEFAPENPITRAEFCKMAVKFLGLTTSGVTHTFSDVPKSHWAAEYISVMAAQGYINGVGDGRFEPETEITLNQAVKIMVSMLGYTPEAQANGGYPAGYNKIGARLEMYKNISATGDEALTRGDAAVLFKNSSEAELMYQTGYGNNNIYSYDGSTVLNIYHGIYTVKGIVTDIGARSIIGSGNVSEGKISVGGTEYFIKDFNPEKLLGLNSTLYIKYEKDSNEGTLIYAYSDDEPIKIEYNNFLDYDGRSLSYIDERGAEKKVNLDANTRIVYNGRYAARAGTADSIDFDCGYMYLINNSSGSGVDIIMIEDYDTYFVTADSRLGHSLYDKFKGSVSFSYDDAKEIEVIKNGKRIEYDEELTIGENNIVQIAKSADNSVVKIYISGRYIEGAVSQAYDDKYLVDGEWYTSSEYFKNSGQDIDIGTDEITIYLDINGNIVVSDVGSNEFSYGYIQACAESGAFLDEVKMRIITESGAAEEYIANDKTALNGKKSETKKISELQRQLIRYKIRPSDNKISDIETAFQNSGGDFSKNTFSLDYTSDNAMFRGGDLNTFNGVYQMDNSTIVFRIPKDETEVSDYRVGGKDILSVDLNYKINVFDVDENYILGAVVVYDDGSADEGVGYSANVMVVSDVKTSVDDGKFILSAEGFVNGSETEITFEEDGADDYTGGWNIAGKGRSTVFDGGDIIRTGDVIQYYTDGSGKCTRVRFLYLAGRDEFFEKNGGDYGVLSDENYYSELYVGVGTVKLKTVSKIMYSASDTGEPLRTLPTSSAAVYIYNSENKTVKPSEMSEISYGDKIFVRMNYSKASEILIIR